MPYIPLTQGQRAQVDEEDFVLLSVHKWHARWTPGTKSFYACRSVTLPCGKRTKVYTHREILALGQTNHAKVDHENHDTRDNRRNNLRVTTQRGNAENQRNQSRHGSGIQLMPSGNYRVQLKAGGKLRHVGTYPTLSAARRARSDFLRSL